MSDPFAPMMGQIGKLWARVRLMPVVRWATVVQASPLRIALDGDTAVLPLTPDSAVKNLRVGDRAICVEQHRRVIVVAAHSDTGWVSLPYTSGFTGGSTPFAYRVRNGVFTVRGSAIGTFPTGVDTLVVPAGAIPSIYRPEVSCRGGAAGASGRSGDFQIDTAGGIYFTHAHTTAPSFMSMLASYPLRP